MEQIVYKNIHNFYKPEGIKNFIRFLMSGKRICYLPNRDKKVNDNLRTSNIDIIDVDENKNKNIFRELNNIGYIWVYLHGSQGDNTTTPFSDFDDLIIIDAEKLTGRNLLKTKKALLKIDMKFCRYDFLQHHGHWIITKQSLQNYDASYMPVSVLQKCKIIKGPESISYNLNLNKTITGLKNNIIKTVENIRILYNDFENNRINIYNLKRLIGSYVLIPPMLFQLLNKEITKPEAIKRAMEIFSIESLNCLTWSTYCRENWNNIYKFLSVRLFKAAKYFFSNPFKYRKFASKYSPVINLKKIGFYWLTKLSSEKFCSETLDLIKNEV